MNYLNILLVYFLSPYNLWGAISSDSTNVYITLKSDLPNYKIAIHNFDPLSKSELFWLEFATDKLGFLKANFDVGTSQKLYFGNTPLWVSPGDSIVIETDGVSLTSIHGNSEKNNHYLMSLYEYRAPRPKIQEKYTHDWTLYKNDFLKYVNTKKYLNDSLKNLFNPSNDLVEFVNLETMCTYYTGLLSPIGRYVTKTQLPKNYISLVDSIQIQRLLDQDLLPISVLNSNIWNNFVSTYLKWIEQENVSTADNLLRGFSAAEKYFYGFTLGRVKFFLLSRYYFETSNNKNKLLFDKLSTETQGLLLNNNKIINNLNALREKVFSEKNELEIEVKNSIIIDINEKHKLLSDILPRR